MVERYGRISLLEGEWLKSDKSVGGANMWRRKTSVEGKAGGDDGKEGGTMVERGVCRS